MAEKSHGVRHLLVVVRSEDMRKCVLVDRAWKAADVPDATELIEMTDGVTVLDGELLEEHLSRLRPGHAAQVPHRRGRQLLDATAGAAKRVHGRFRPRPSQVPVPSQHRAEENRALPNDRGRRPVHLQGHRRTQPVH